MISEKNSPDIVKRACDNLVSARQILLVVSCGDSCLFFIVSNRYWAKATKKSAPKLSQELAQVRMQCCVVTCCFVLCCVVLS